MAAGETKELTSVRRGRARVAAAASGTPRLHSGSKGRSLQGFRATKKWVDDTAQCRADKASNATDSGSKAAISRTPSKKEGRVQFKQENEHLTSKLVYPVSAFGPSPLRKDGFPNAQAAALAPISLNSLPGFRLVSRISNSTSKPVPLADNSDSNNPQTSAPILHVPNTLTDGKTLQQAVPCVRNEGGERKVVWCNPAFCEDSEDRRFSNDSAASAQTTARCSPPTYTKSVDVGQGQDHDIPRLQQKRSQSIEQEEESSSSSLSTSAAVGVALLSGKINNGARSGEKLAGTSPAFSSVSAVAGSPAAAMPFTPDDRGESLRARFELESAAGNWYTPVMSSVTPEGAGNSRRLDRLMELPVRTKKTPAQPQPFQAGSAPHVFFSSPANHLCSAAAGLSRSTREENPGESWRRPSSNLNHVSDATTSDCGGPERRSSRKLVMQPLVDGTRLRSHKSSGSRGGDVTEAGQSKAQGPPRTDLEAMVEADLETDIARDMEEEIAKEILYLNQRLAALHARQDMRRLAWGEKSKAGHSCPQTPLRCAPSPSEPAAVSAIEEEKRRPASESKRKSGRVVAAKFLQSAAERSKSVLAVDRSSRRRLLSDSPSLGPANVPRRSLGTPARLLAKLKSAPISSGSPDDHRHQHVDQCRNSKGNQSRSKVSAEKYVRERSSAATGGIKSKSAVLKEIFREELEACRHEAVSSKIAHNLDRPNQHARSLSMGSAVQSRHFLEFERKIDWVKTLRSETVPHSTIGMPSIGQLIDDSGSKQICKDTQDIHAWLRENHGNVEIDEETQGSEETEPVPIICPPSSRVPLQRCDQSNNHTLHPERRAIHHQQQQLQTGPFVAPSPTPSKAGRPWTTPTRNTPSPAAAARSYSPSVRARSVPSRYGTPVRAKSKTPGTSEKRVTDPKLVLESPVRRIDYALRSGGKETPTSSGSQGWAVVRKPTIRKGYPGVTGFISKAECGDCDLDIHCSRHHHHHHHSGSAGKLKDNTKCMVGSNNNSECMKRKDSFAAEYEKFVVGSEIVEKQVSELYHAAMENVSAVEPLTEPEAVDSSTDDCSSSRTATKHTYIRCIDLIKDKTKAQFFLKGKRAKGQSVLPATDGQDSDDSVLARSIPRTESSEQDLEEELIRDGRSADEQLVEDVVEVKEFRNVNWNSEPGLVSRGNATNSYIMIGMVEIQLDYEDTLMNERLCLPKVRAKTENVHDETPRDSGCVKRISDQHHRVHPFSEYSRGQRQWQSPDNEGLSPDEIEGLDLESFWCLVGELDGPIMIPRP